MANRYWDGSTSSDPTDVNNWSDIDGGGTPASSVPGTGDHAYFTANGDGNPCTLTAHWTLGNLTVLVGYTSKIDLATYNLTFDSGGSATLDGAGEFDCGTGSHSVTNGTLDYRDQTTWTRATSTWTFNSTCSIIGHGSKALNNVTFASGSTVTIDVNTTSLLAVNGTFTINGAVVLNKPLSASGDCDLVVNSGASFSGASVLYLSGSTPSHGLITLHSSVSMPETQVNLLQTGSVLAAGTWTGLFTVLGSGYNVLQPNGVYNFNGGLKIRCTAGSAQVFDNSVNGATINVTDLTIELTSTGNITIDDSGQEVDWNITGNVVVTDTGAGTITWTNGTGLITASGSSAQDWDFNGLSVEDIVVNKTAGVLTFSGAVTTESFIGTSTGTGSFDPNEQTITTTGNCSWAAAFVLNSAATAMNGCSWIVGGNFTADGQTLNATSSWTLTVTGTAVASGIGTVEYSNASSGTEITATAWTDDGNNSNWSFLGTTSNIHIGFGLDENSEPFIAIKPDQNVKIVM